ncbi:MAG: DUF2007 domain-containing protein [Kordiimonadaceae bacterium]|nr:DUF2007 domain-containing protein [Kordiimonadaceae bacterium]MBO6569428.1 DUF2007 domain-containing protein [Kordiimonadaceae bacterium]MBO6964903.1 DUF2007 domain-containing protein [Kordiimonadaceae bacterium]
MKIVYETADYPEVLIKKGILEDSGIPVYVDNLHSAGGAMPELGFTLGYKIMVPDAAEAEALAIVNDIESELTSEEDKDAGKQVPTVASFPWSLVRVFAAILVIIFALNIVGSALAASTTVCMQEKSRKLDCSSFPLGWTDWLESRLM